MNYAIVFILGSWLGFAIGVGLMCVLQMAKENK